MTDIPIRLDRASVADAVADYILQVNFRGYSPDPRKVLAVRQTDRTAWLRDVATPARREVFYYVEGELFPEPGATRLVQGDTPAPLAARLVARIWDDARTICLAATDFPADSHSNRLAVTRLT
jgi:hypothetical protein